MIPSDLADDRRYSPAEVAPLFGVSRVAVSSWCRRRLIPALLTPGGHYRILGSDAKAVHRRGLTVRSAKAATGTLKMREARAMADIDRLCAAK